MSSLYPTLAEDSQKTAAVDQSPVAEREQGKAPDYGSSTPGPTQNRKCQDVLFLILFALFWVGMIVIGGIAIKQGNLDRLKYGNDTDGNLCGTANSGQGTDMTDKTYQYVFYPWDPTSYRRCMTACPNATLDYVCKYNVSAPQTQLQFAQAFQNKDCTYTYKTNSALNRCLPDASALLQYVTKYNNDSTGTNSTSASSSVSSGTFDFGDTAVQVFQDLHNSWRIILICAFIALALSFVWLFLIQWFAGAVIWFTVIAVNLVSIGFTAFLWKAYLDVKAGNTDNAVSQYVSTGSKNETALLAIAIISSIVTVVLFLLIVALRSRIRLAVGLIKETSKAVRAIPMIIFFPIAKYFVLAALIAWTLYICILLATSGSTVAATVNNAAAQHGAQFQPNRVLQGLAIYYTLGFFWTFNWILAIAQCTIAGAIASWYWARDKKSIPAMPVLASFKRTMTYHMGSLAFGALIIAIIQTIRAVLAYIQNYCKRNKASTMVKAVLACLQCCFACMESMMKFLNTNAYIEIAVYGYSFCEAARTAFSLLMRNAIRLVVLDKVGDFLFFLGKMFITLLTSLIAVAMLKNPQYAPGPDDIDVGRFWAIPLILVAMFSYIIASCFMAVFDMAVSTIFLCFCEDCERNDGSAGKPYFMTDSLKQFIDTSNKKAPKV